MMQPRGFRVWRQVLVAVVVLGASLLATLPAQAELGKDWVEALHIYPWAGAVPINQWLAPYGSLVYNDAMFLIGSQIWQSSDAASWQVVRQQMPWGGQGYCVVFQDKLWAIATTTLGYSTWFSWFSTDGVNWTQGASLPFGDYVPPIVFNDKMWLLASGSDTLLYSSLSKLFENVLYLNSLEMSSLS